MKCLIHPYSLLIPLALIGFSLSIYGQDHHPVYINEFMASNTSTIADMVDHDDFSDWIELYNGGDESIDIGGYFITDRADNPYKWQFPYQTIIESKGYLLIWADGEDDFKGNVHRRNWFDQNGETIYFTSRAHHTNFSLGRGGEYIGLYMPDGTLVDEINFGLQYRDVSRGRNTDASSDWVFFGEPTPGLANTTEGVQEVVFSNPTMVSPNSGQYASGIQVSISSSESSDIRFTLDGSKPLSTSEMYSEPFSLAATSILSTRSFASGKIPGKISHNSFLISENHSLPVVSIISDPEYLFGGSKGIYSNRLKGREVPIHLDYFDENGSLQYSSNTGLRLTGQASLYYPQISLTLSARDRYGNDTFEYAFFPQRKNNEFKLLYLRNGGYPDNRSTLFRDALQNSLVINEIDLDCQAYQPSVVYINGEYWGIYNIREKINEDYLADLHNINPNEVDFLEYEKSEFPTAMSGSAKEWLTFFGHMEDKDLSQTENYEWIRSQMDVEEYINYMISQIYFDNTIWLDENVRMWKERKPGSKWRWILFDTDYGFNMFTPINNNTLSLAMGTSQNNKPAWSTLLFRKLLENEEFKFLFIQRFSTYLNTIFNPSRVVYLIDSLEQSLLPEMDQHIFRWLNYEPYGGSPIQSTSEWKQNVNNMREFGLQRPQHVRTHLSNAFNLPGSYVLTLTTAEPGQGKLKVNGVNVNESHSGSYFTGIPLDVEAIPAVGYQFVGWEGISVDPSRQIRIYPEESLNIIAIFEKIDVSLISGHISKDSTLFTEFSPYYATGDIIVDPHVKLTIQEGIELYMPENSSVIVQGSLFIDGSSQNPVIIYPNEYSVNWGGISFKNATDSSSLSNLIISNATEGPDYITDKAAISSYNSTLLLDHIEIIESKSPIYFEKGKAYIRNSTLKLTETGDLINVVGADYAEVVNCILEGSDFYDSDAIDYDQLTGGIVKGNRIYNFFGFNSDAIDLGEGTFDIQIESNLVYNIQDKGVSIGNGSTAIITRNRFVNCGQGVGIKDSGSYGEIDHNTFYGNTYGVATFEKNIGVGGGKADVTHSIFAESRFSSVWVDELSELNLVYNLSDRDTLGVGNLSPENPKFLNELTLSAVSPAIDAGDPGFALDDDGSITDIGAIPYSPTALSTLIINEVYIDPPEGDGFEYIELVNQGKKLISLNQFEVSGDVSHQFPDISLNPGEYILLAANTSNYSFVVSQVFNWDVGNLSSDNGWLEIRDAQGSLIDHITFEHHDWWAKEGFGGGYSLELNETSMENMAASSWRSSYLKGGSPGLPNDSYDIEGLYINEILADNNNGITDEFGNLEDWIELTNESTDAINLAGLYLTDDINQPDKFRIPLFAPTQTQTADFILFYADNEIDEGPLHTNFELNRLGEQVALYQKKGEEFVLLDSVSFDQVPSDYSWNRYKDETGWWYAASAPSPLAANIYDPPLSVSIPGIEELVFKNYPNPFSRETTLQFVVPKKGWVSLIIVDYSGREVAQLIHEEMNSGKYEMPWRRSGLKEGIYLAVLRTRDSIQTTKMVIR